MVPRSLSSEDPARQGGEGILSTYTPRPRPGSRFLSPLASGVQTTREEPILPGRFPTARGLTPWEMAPPTGPMESCGVGPSNPGGEGREDPILFRDLERAPSLDRSITLPPIVPVPMRSRGSVPQNVPQNPHPGQEVWKMSLEDFPCTFAPDV